MEALNKRTALFESHRRLGARMTSFGGFEMPVSYTGIIEEHLAVRSCAGIFDLGHMGEFELRGGGALKLLQRAMTNDAAKLEKGRAHYTLMCMREGGTIDDLIVYRLGEARYMLCVNASNTEADREWLAELGAGAAGFRDISQETGLVAVQGPKAAAILQKMTQAPVTEMRRFGVIEAEVAGSPCVVARTGYTGEDGFELFSDTDASVRLFESILEDGRSIGLMPCGLGARDTLRMEAGLPLYGHELGRETSPLEAGLGAFVKLGREFIGAEALAVQQREGISRRLIGIRTDDARSVARPGYGIFLGDRKVGVVTSGTFAPSFNRPLGMAYLGTAAGEPDSVQVEIRNKRISASVVALPFHRRGKPPAAVREISQ
jgi:aminomethyltransferase